MFSPSDFDFELPEASIAQEPSEARGGSRLLILDRNSGAIEHSSFLHLHDHLRAGDLLVVNNTKVFQHDSSATVFRVGEPLNACWCDR